MLLYNTYTRKEESLETIEKGKVGIYSCGPTVYHYAHIGNMRTYLFVDFLKRALKFQGYEVKHVMNITDVGHLLSDADLGEDKMLLAALRDNKSVWDVARYYTETFLRDIRALNIVEPEVWCKATDHIPEQIALIEKLERNGYTYTTSDGVYFDTSKFPDYAKFASLILEDQKAGARVEVNYEKRQSWDFVLWKFSPASQSGDVRQMEWESPWGVGFPGWHIECSAMATKYLGQPFDIHTGAVDLISVHHTNEIAQSEAAYEKPLAKYWLHAEFLTMDAKKMSKSSGDFMTLQDILDRGYDPLAFRFFCLSAHYRQVLNFTWEALEASQQGLKRLRTRLSDIGEHGEGVKPGSKREDNPVITDLVRVSREQFTTALQDNLSMPRAIAVVFSLLDRVAKESLSVGDYQLVYNTIMDFDHVLGLDLDQNPKTAVIPDHVQLLVLQRDKARAERDWGKSDTIRDEIERFGYEVGDSPEGTKITPR